MVKRFLVTVYIVNEYVVIRSLLKYEVDSYRSNYCLQGTDTIYSGHRLCVKS